MHYLGSVSVVCFVVIEKECLRNHLVIFNSKNTFSLLIVVILHFKDRKVNVFIFDRQLLLCK
jgi:hypothetical protein